MIDYNLTVVKDKLKEIALQILEHERDKTGIREDMSDIKKEMGAFLPKSLIMKVLNVYLQKGGIKDSDLEEYQMACRILGFGYNCQRFIPEDGQLTEEQKGKRAKIVSICNRYDSLRNELNEHSVEIRGLYAQAKNCGISVPLLKKLVDFVLHPDKLRAYHDDTPLLEAYVEVIPDIE